MRIADAVAALATPPDVVVAGDDAVAALAERVGGALGLPVVRDRDEGIRVVLIDAQDVGVVAALDGGMDRTGGLRAGEVCLLLLDAGPVDLPVEAIAAGVAAHDLELTAVTDLAHPTLTVALHLCATTEPALGTARTELLLERRVTRRARAAANAMAHELERRGERIDALQAEVTELRERVETLEVQHERELERRDRQLAVVDREADDLRGSTSYRIGHLLVRVLQDPSLLLRVPGKALRRMRS